MSSCHFYLRTYGGWLYLNVMFSFKLLYGITIIRKLFDCISPEPSINVSLTDLNFEKYLLIDKNSG